MSQNLNKLNNSMVIDQTSNKLSINKSTQLVQNDNRYNSIINHQNLYDKNSQSLVKYTENLVKNRKKSNSNKYKHSYE